jgi:outer membrane protein assembly factor BamB
VGSPLVDADLVWVVAGRHTSTDGSAILHALDLRSGRPAWIHPLTAADMPKAYKFEQCWIDLLQTDVHDRLMASMALTFDPTRREIAKVGNQGKSKGSRAGSGASEPGAYCCWRPAHVGARGGTTGWNSFRHDASREHMAFVQTPGGRGQGGQGDKIAVLGRDYYTVTRARVNGTLALARWTLDEQGRVSAKPEWEQLHDLTSQKARRRTEGTGVAAMIVAADRIYIACYDDKGAPVVDAFDRATGKLVDGVALPAGREVVNNGLAAAYGRLYVACADGAVLCFGP